MFIPLWLMIYVSIFISGIWAGQIIGQGEQDKLLIIIFTVISLILFMLFLVICCGYSPSILLF